MVSTSAAGTNEVMVERPSLEDASRAICALANKITLLDTEEAEKMVADLQMVKGEMNSLKKRLNEAEKLNESLRKEKNDEIDKLKESYEGVLKEKDEEIERLNNAIKEERKAKIPPKFPAKIIGKLCKKDSVDSLRKTIVVTVPQSPTPVGKQVIVKIDVTEAGYEALDIVVKDPDGHEVATQVVEVEEGVLHVEFKARLLGTYIVYVNYAGEAVAGWFHTGVFDVSKVAVGKVTISAYNNKEEYFDINSRNAGVGEIKVAVNDAIISYCDFRFGVHRYKFIRDEMKDYVISVLFNDVIVPGTPIHLKSGDIPK